jgi:hypothetical protein
VSRGRKVKRHACNVIGTCSKGEMESSCASALPAREPENIEAARERETNASEPLAVPEVAGERETNAPCPMETTESMGARETNVPEERSAAVRRDGELLASAAKKQRQKEAASNKHQAAAGERPPSPVREGTGPVPLSATDPGCQPREAAGTDQPQLPAAIADRVKAARGNSVLNCDSEVGPPGGEKDVSQISQSWHGLFISISGATQCCQVAVATAK